MKLSGVHRVAILHSTNSFAADVAQGLFNKVALEGLTVTYEGQYVGGGWTSPTNFSQFPPMAQAACASGADAFFGIGVLDDAAELLKAVDNVPGCSPKAFFLNSAPSQGDWVAQHTRLATKYALLGPSQWHEHERYSDRIFGTAQDFCADLQVKEQLSNSYPPSYIAAAAAVAGYVLLEAVSSVYVSGSGQLPNQSAVAQALRQFTQLDTFFGPVGFKVCTETELNSGQVSCGRNMLKPMITTQVQAGEIKIVSPVDQADTTFRYPSSSILNSESQVVSHAVRWVVPLAASMLAWLTLRPF